MQAIHVRHAIRQVGEQGAVDAAEQLRRTATRDLGTGAAIEMRRKRSAITWTTAASNLSLSHEHAERR